MSISPKPPPIPQGKSRRKLLPTVVVLGLALLLLGPLIAYTSYRRSTTSAIRKLEATIKQRGEPLTLAELAATYPPIPEAENGAIRLLEVWGAEAPEFWHAFRAGEKKLPERARVNWDFGIPYFKTSTERIPRTADLPTNILRTARQVLQDHDSHLEKIREALAFAQFQFPVQLTNGQEALLPHLAELRKAVHGFLLRALVHLEDQKLEDALVAMEDAARTMNVVAREPVLISQLLRATTGQRMLDMQERLLSRSRWTEAQLKRVAAINDTLDLTNRIHLVLLSERAFLWQFMSLPPRTIAQAIRGSGREQDEAWARDYSLSSLAFKWSGVSDKDRLFFLETMDEAVVLTEEGTAEEVMQAEYLLINASRTARNYPPKPLSALLLPSLPKAMNRLLAAEARLRAAKVAVAVLRHQAVQGAAFPKTLEELIPSRLPQLPLDPYDDEPIRFKPLTNGFVAYALGENRTDDDGRERRPNGTALRADVTFIVER